MAYVKPASWLLIASIGLVLGCNDRGGEAVTGTSSGSGGTEPDPTTSTSSTTGQDGSSGGPLGCQSDEDCEAGEVCIVATGLCECAQGYVSCDQGCCEVDHGTVFMGDTSGPSIAVDSAGTPHVSFMVDSYELMYARLGPSGWEVESIGQDDANEYSTAIAIDLDDTPVVAYQANWSIWLTRPGNAAWTHEELYYSASGYGPELFARAVAVGPDGEVHVVARQEQNFGATSDTRLRHFYRDAGAWTDELIVESYDARYTPPSVAIDSAGALHVGYNSFFDQTLGYATNASGSWVAGAAIEGARCCDAAHVTLDASGSPYIAFQENNGGYAVAEGSSTPWTSTVHMEMMTGVGDIAFDAAGRLHYAVADADYNVVYGRPNGNDWDEQTVIPSVTAFMMTLDDQGHAHFVASTETALVYARVDG